VFCRPVMQREMQIGLGFLNAPAGADNGKTALTRWEQYAQILLSTNEFLYVD
jgi:hypothetical protein